MWQDLFRKKSIQQIELEAASGLSDGHGSGGLNKVLGVRDLTFMGIAAIVGAGIFSTIGTASFQGGPGVVFLFLFVSIACGFSAVCYAEFASMVPVSGSAYTYSYVAFGEIIAWIIGWDLLMEYAIGNIAVAISWSDYFTTLLDGLGLHIPEFLTMDYWTAKAGATADAKLAWANAPSFGSFKLICDLPAFLITVVITAIIYIGIKESKRLMNGMVILKMAVIVLVIIAGAFYVKPVNWHPFMPNGIAGVLGGTAAVFFSYIGFDAISTTAEECRNPQRDLPRGMFYSLIICTVVYVLIALVLTGMVSYKELNVGDPLAHVFQSIQMDWMAGIISVSAVIATASVLLVFQLGQPRIWMSMSRDGLLPPVFSRIHPKYKTPSFSTVLTGFVVGIPALFMNLNDVVALTSVGTLFAFVLVCGGILLLEERRKKGDTSQTVSAIKFKTPYVNGQLIVPALFITAVILFLKFYPGGVSGFLSGVNEKGESGWSVWREKVPYLLFGTVFLATTILSFVKKLSLIPVLGFLCCTYLLCESGTTNWERFVVWLVIGLCLYFVYGKKHSRLRR
ncbi:amino acid permease [Taibaiella soli]|uniref:Amino acid transporter n=1 Tax=Taibaiella soli TaxID=1649169 RepID=A0A2W2AXX4_9BACT|nr:amino acid permease [Taibaiella soli]PZF72538.1 amino acid transporter [Taibaiella soli]